MNSFGNQSEQRMVPYCWFWKCSDFWIWQMHLCSIRLILIYRSVFLHMISIVWHVQLLWKPLLAFLVKHITLGSEFLKCIFWDIYKRSIMARISLFCSLSYGHCVPPGLSSSSFLSGIDISNILCDHHFINATVSLFVASSLITSAITSFLRTWCQVILLRRTGVIFRDFMLNRHYSTCLLPHSSVCFSKLSYFFTFTHPFFSFVNYILISSSSRHVPFSCTSCFFL